MNGAISSNTVNAAYTAYMQYVTALLNGNDICGFISAMITNITAAASINTPMILETFLLIKIILSYTEFVNKRHTFAVYIQGGKGQLTVIKQSFRVNGMRNSVYGQGVVGVYIYPPPKVLVGIVIKI